MDFDPVDRQILDILRQEGRASHARIDKQVGLSAPAVVKRVAKLEQSGVILGYRAVLDHAAVGLPIGAFVMITPQPRKPAQRLVDRLLELPEVEALYAVAGEYSFIALVRAPSPSTLDALLDRIFMLEGVEATRTAMVLRTAAERVTFLPPGDAG